MLTFGYILTTAITQYGWRITLRILSAGVFVVGTAAGLLLTDPPTDEKYITVEYQSKDQELEMGAMVAMNEANGGCIKKTKDKEAKDGTPDLREENYHNESSHDSLEIRVNCRGMLTVMKDLEPWLWAAGSMLGFLGWTFFNINFVSKHPIQYFIVCNSQMVRLGNC